MSKTNSVNLIAGLIRKRSEISGQLRVAKKAANLIQAPIYQLAIPSAHCAAYRLFITNGIKTMPKISFNPNALGSVVTNKRGNVCDVIGQCAFIPVVVDKPGIEAIYEGLRLANIDGFNGSREVGRHWN